MSMAKITRKDRKGPVGHAARVYDVVENGYITGRSARKISRDVREILSEVKEKEMEEVASILFKDLTSNQDLYTMFVRVQANLEVDAFVKRFKELQFKADSEYVKTQTDKVAASANETVRAVNAKIEEDGSDMWSATPNDDEESEEPRVFLTNTKKTEGKSESKMSFFNMDKEARKALIKEELELRPGIIKAKVSTQARMSLFHLKHAFGFKG